ncbi:Uncharacterised protein [Mycobacterium tuberculosis]|uniref:Uncharacterized protein n=1 Tax=Mycobacterium tuberculosis TaxID=1773 RepID=A0A916PBL3_MYCTX|nr:Uncharacterised protein [Mycobacterium tuberculosis]
MAWSSRNRDPALGPRLTTSNAEPGGSPSTPETALSVPACAGASSSLRKSARKTEVVSTVTSSEVWSFSISGFMSVTRCSSLAAVALSDRVVRPASRYSLPPIIALTTFSCRCLDRTAHGSAMCAPQRIPGSIALPGPDPCRPATSHVTLAGTLAIVTRSVCRGRPQRRAVSSKLTPGQRHPSCRPGCPAASRLRRGRNSPIAECRPDRC